MREVKEKLHEAVPQSGHKTAKPTIICGPHHVVICGQGVIRPVTISPMQWMHFWESIIIRELT
jgi:hypothetical protein